MGAVVDESVVDESVVDCPRATPRPLARAAIALVIVYQHARAGRPSPCRFWPSCSQYAREAIETHGLWRGGLLTARRLGRCRPLGAHGVDPVPQAWETR